MCEDKLKKWGKAEWRFKYLSTLKKQKWTFHPLYRKQEMVKNRFEIDTAVKESD